MNANLILDSIMNSVHMNSLAQSAGITIDELCAALQGLKVSSPDSVPSLEEEAETDSESLDSGVDSDLELKLSDEQLAFIDLVAGQKKNVFLCAAAGYGKSFCIMETVDRINEEFLPYPASWFEKRYGKFCMMDDDLTQRPVVAICASTGKAASLLRGARTLHSYFGIGIARGDPKDWYQRVSTMKYMRDTLNNLRSVQVIIIDEISMISAQLLDKLNVYLQLIRNSEDVFGGVQIVLVGDISQLGPVQGDFMFRAESFKSGEFYTHQLTKCFRQNDLVFQNILSEVRFGKCSPEAYKTLLAQTSIDADYSEGMRPMKIMATNVQVDAVNEKELQSLCCTRGEAPTEFPIRHISTNKKRNDVFRKADGIPEEVKLVVGAQVVVTHNINRSIVNGSQGVIVSMADGEVKVKFLGFMNAAGIGYIAYKDPDHDVYTAPAIFEYLPLRLSYGSTIHKCQGSTLQLLEIDASRIFSPGQFYVAVSRITSMKGLIIKGLSRKCIVCDPSVKRFLGVQI